MADSSTRDAEQTQAIMDALGEWDAADIADLRRMVPDIWAVMTYNPLVQVYFRAGLLACRETADR